MTLRLRAHREVVEEYLLAIGQDNSYVVTHDLHTMKGGPSGYKVAGAVNYDDDEDAVPCAIGSGGGEAVALPIRQEPHLGSVVAPPPFDVISSANTLAMLLRVFGEKVVFEKEEGARRMAEREDSSVGISSFAGASSPIGRRNYTPLSPAGHGSPRTPAYPFSPAGGSGDQHTPSANIDCWVDEGEMQMATEALRRFKVATGMDGVRGGLLGQRPIMPPALTAALQSREAEHAPESGVAEGLLAGDTVGSGVSCDGSPNSSPPLTLRVVRPAARVVWQKQERAMGGVPIASAALKGMANAMPPPAPARQPLHSAAGERGSAEVTRAAPVSRHSGGADEGQNACGNDGNRQQETVIADIHKMVAEMRNSAFTMKESLQAEAGVMGDTANLLQTATAKTMEQTRKVNTIAGVGGGEVGAGAIEAALRKVLPSAVVSMLMGSLTAIIGLVKTILWVLMILGITGCTLMVIIMRKKATVVTIEESVESDL